MKQQIIALTVMRHLLRHLSVLLQGSNFMVEKPWVKLCVCEEIAKPWPKLPHLADGNIVHN